MKKLNLIGQKFGKLTVKEQINDNSKMTKWLCECDCGNEFIARGTRLKNGITDNCGCERGNKVRKYTTKHGMRNTHFYNVWVSMKQRCDNPNTKNAKYYYDKGITYCNEWKDFQNFYNDMYNTYTYGNYLDRIDNSKNYSPNNCRWINVTESNRNKTTTLTIEQVKEIRQSNKSRTELAKQYNVHYMTITKILQYKTWKNI